MKKIFTLLIAVLVFTAGCKIAIPANTNNSSASNSSNTVATTNTTESSTNAEASITLHTSVPNGWESDEDSSRLINLHRADPAEGYRESEIVYPNEGYFFAQLFTKGTNDFTAYQLLLDQTVKRTDKTIFRGPPTSEEPITINGMSGKRYFFADTMPNNADNQFFIETVLRYDEHTIITMNGQYGAGSDNAQLEADVLAIQNSLTVSE